MGDLAKAPLRVTHFARSFLPFLTQDKLSCVTHSALAGRQKRPHRHQFDYDFDAPDIIQRAPPLRLGTISYLPKSMQTPRVSDSLSCPGRFTP